MPPVLNQLRGAGSEWIPNSSKRHLEAASNVGFLNILVKNRRCSLDKLRNDHPGAIIVDVTSKGPEPWVRFSPFYPHGEIPVPNSPGVSSQSVEGLWQGLKVFETADIDPGKFEIQNMKGLERTVRRFGNCLGHRYGTEGEELLGYREARYRLYLPAYRWVLENKLNEEMKALLVRKAENDLILLDYETNCDVDDLSRPLSHAGLVRARLLENWPNK